MIQSMSTDLKDFGPTLRAKREERGLSLAEASRLSGVSKPNIWVLEEGSNDNPKVGTIVALADLYRVSPVSLFRALIRRKAKEESK